MNPATGFLARQCKMLLENKPYAYLAISFFTLIPFATWLAVAFIALITLRKGEKEGIQALLLAMIVNLTVMMLLAPVQAVFYSTLINFVPAFIAAYVLRCTASWRYSLGSLFFQSLLTVGLIQVFAPELINEQFMLLKSLLTEYQDFDGMFVFGEYGKKIDQNIMAHLLFSAQMVSVLLSTVLSLLCARWMQAKCYNPGGFKKEVFGFRSGKFALVLLLLLFPAAYSKVLVAIDLLPLVLLYFLVAGAVLAYVVLSQKKIKGAAILMSLSLLVKPIIIFPVYIILGLLDSIFNFRVYLLAKKRELA
ncbi:hypothetical protein E3983_06585 [Legionella israelensis]|uniref:DUF2232 domain-containing protein n=1 Tax=Legionella israelensis TaxID=454 RepID=A0AAX1EG06_9GAMM|nr:hypothetical protein [Legionella israelensis]QBR84048.1 hypothetical protein E3983_06585 [Legionella israelensis]